MPSRAAQIETGVLYCADNLALLSDLPSDSVQLIYLDPPFFSNRTYEVIWGEEAEVRSFEDRWNEGLEGYVDWMRHRAIEIHRVLAPNGTMYLHCDQHASHYLKVMLDHVFGGIGHCMDEIIWHYQTASGAPKNRLHRNHDTIFRYAKNPKDVIWNHPRDPWPESTLKKWQRDDDGRIYRQQHKFGKRYYVDPAGKLGDDVWEITLSSRSGERLGYPTQKPEALLRKIIAASSNEGDLVLDPFCGCGTTVMVAERMKREWIGIDISQTAVRLMARRLKQATNGRCHPRIEGLPVTIEDLHKLKPFEFQNWVMLKTSATSAARKTGDMGIDGWTYLAHEPIQVKQSEKVGRNVVDNFETAMRRAKETKGEIVAFSFTSGARQEAARARVHDGLDIKLRTVAELLASTDEYGPLDKKAAVVEMPIVLPREPKDLPSAGELRKSETG